MKKHDYNVTIVAKASAEEAFEKISHVSDWWTSNVEGSSKNINDVFTTRFGETFVTFKIVEAIPGKKAVWHVTDCYLHWLKDKKEWKDTEMTFEIVPKDDATQINVTHVGLVPEIECYNDCKKGWDFYLKESLFKFITEGKGLPETPKASR